MPKNKITTQGYFIKRLRDCGYYVCRLFDKYSTTDSRRWTIVVNPNVESVFITCYKSNNFTGQGLYEFNDGGVRIPKNYNISTDSVEVIVTHLNEFNVIGKCKLNNING